MRPAVGIIILAIVLLVAVFAVYATKGAPAPPELGAVGPDDRHRERALERKGRSQRPRERPGRTIERDHRGLRDRGGPVQG